MIQKIWTEEFEKMWRCRLVEMNNEKQPFQKFIEVVVEAEVLEAFKMALDEIDRLRSNEHQVHLCETWKG